MGKEAPIVGGIIATLLLGVVGGLGQACFAQTAGPTASGTSDQGAAARLAAPVFIEGDAEKGKGPAAPGSAQRRETPSPPATKIPREGERTEDRATFNLRGRIHTDAIFVNQSERNKETIGDLENATGFRRARL